MFAPQFLTYIPINIPIRSVADDTSSLAAVASVHEGAFDAREGRVEWAWLQKKLGGGVHGPQFEDVYCFAEVGLG